MSINCSVCGEPPFEVVWLYSTSLNDTYDDLTIIADSKVYNNVYTVQSNGTKSVVVWNTSLQLNITSNSTVGYYYCRVNNSLGYKYSRPYYLNSSCKFIIE